MSRPDDTGADDDGGFLGRWAKRKQQVQRETASPAPVTEAPVNNPPVQTGESLPNSSSTSLPLPSLEDIVPGGDVSAFFQKHVPEALRAAALRKVWMTDPDIRDFIEMADYQLDYANPDSIPGWSTSIEGIDLKSMVEKIFNNAPKIDAEPLETGLPVPAGNTEAGNPPADDLHAHETLVEGVAETQTGPENPNLIQNGAVQNTPEESVVYETARKRHGSALPT